MDVNEVQNESKIISDNITNAGNVTNIGRLSEAQWVNIIYFVLLVCGSVVNLVHILALIRSKRSGMYVFFIAV